MRRDHQRAKEAADNASEALRAAVEEHRAVVEKMQDPGDESGRGDIDLFALLAHDMRNEEQRRNAERGE